MANQNDQGYELSSLAADGLPNDNHDARAEFSLPRADGGRQAWAFLLAAFVAEALVWGFPYSFGVFEKYYSTHEPFSKDPSGIAAIPTTASGIMYLSAPFLLPVLQRWPRFRRSASCFGLVIMVLSLIAASFAISTWQLIMTQGVMFALGGTLFYSPVLLFLDEWFVRRKGLAFGTMWAGTGASGTAIPFISGWLLDVYGHQSALRIWAIVTAVLSIPCLFFLKGRLPIAGSSGPRRTDFSFVTSPAFWFLEGGNVALNLGYSLPSIYMSSYAAAAGFSNISGTLSIAFFNATAAIGGILAGLLIDRFHVTTVTVICGIGSAVAVLLFWGFAVSEPVLYIFAILYGTFAGSFSTTWSGCANALRRRGRNVETGSVMSLLIGGKGIGAVVSGPLSSALIQAAPWKGKAIGAYGSSYGALVVFTGITSFLGAASFCGRLLGLV